MAEISRMIKLFSESGLGDVYRFSFNFPSTYNGVYNLLTAQIKEQLLVSVDDNSHLKLYWKDEDGDTITMNSDTSVKYGLQHNSGVFRIYYRLEALPSISLVIRGETDHTKDYVADHVEPTTISPSGSLSPLSIDGQ